MSEDQRRSTASRAAREDESRRARLAELRSEDARKARLRSRLKIAATLLAAVVVVGGAGAALVSTASGGSPDDGTRTSGIDPDKVNVRGEKLYEDLDRGHVTGGVDYSAGPTPPVGGRHDPTWQNANGDVYTEPLKNEHAVHALEHGAVWVTYSGSAPAKDVAALRSKVEGVPYRMMSPVAGQDSPVKLTAWGHQLSVESPADPRVDAFFDAYVQGPQAPEPGAPVTGGRAEP